MKKQCIAVTAAVFALTTLSNAGVTPASTTTSVAETTEDSWFNGEFGVGTQAGFHGIGLHLRYDVTDQFYLRLEGNYFQLDYDDEIDGVDYEGKLDFSNVGLLANYMPFAGGFRVTGGVFGGALEADASGRGAGNVVEVDDIDYVLGATDSLHANVEYSSFSPYLGIGWDFVLGAEQNWIIGLDVGVLYIGEADVEIKGEGELFGSGINQITEAELDAERESLESELSGYEFLPVFKLSLTYRF